jgi:phosphate starvation-inducible PhoH-like protein
VSRGGNGGGQALQLEFDDNSLLPMLFGEHDRHLARIEQRLGVRLASRGNRVTIDGPHSASEAARGALNWLYERLRRGQAVDMGDVDAAMRLAATPDRADARDLFGDEDLVVRTRKRRVNPRTQGQVEYLRALHRNELVFGIGPAGTGKTYLAVAMAVQMLAEGKVDRIVLSRPAVEAGERLGFLPGDMREKIDPYLRPLYDALYDMMPGDQVIRRMASGEIEIAPLAFMRGRTLNDAFVILDEAQNTTSEQMKMFLTRLGFGSKAVVTGDITQIDLPNPKTSGLVEALKVVREIEGIGIVHFDDKDVVRHTLVQQIVRAYEAYSKPNGQ